VKLHDYLHDAPWYARKATVPVRNGLYRATGPVRSARGNLRNWRNRRFLQTGKGFWLEHHTRRLRSSLPVYRDRINRATGRPRRDDAEVYGRRDLRLAKAREGGVFDPSRAWEHSAGAYRSAPAHEVTVSRQRINERADAVLGPGRSARTAGALRQASANPWESPQRGRAAR
jgi:hypothetical protein